MALRFYNSLARCKEAFRPLEGGKVRMYHCGPTVYGFAHVGNFRAFMLADLLRRYLEFRGFDVLQVMNITDVGHLTDDADEGEDKVEAAARREKVDPFKIVDRYIRAFHEDVRTLGILPAHVYPRATEHIAEMIELIESLVRAGLAYEVGGCVYFEVSRFSGYGKLSGNTVEKLRVGSRVDVHQDKRSPLDFALWKRDPRHLMQWDSPWGRGFPGWHVECSAMSMKYLGSSFDIHTGGEDNVFPHHECEIAQSEGATGEPFVRYWLHTRHLLVDGSKMSKSAGNFYTLRDLLDRGFEGRAIRYALLGTHYRQPYNLTLEGLEGAGRAVGRINDFYHNLDPGVESGEASPPVGAALDSFCETFREALDDDLNVSPALGGLFEFMRKVNKERLGKGDVGRIRACLREVDRVLGVLEEARGGLDEEIAALVEERRRARAARDFERADAIRERLRGMGIAVEDTPGGMRWKRFRRGPG